MARKNAQSLMDGSRAVADKAMDTWSELTSTLETAVGRTQSAAQDAQKTMKSTRKNAEDTARKTRRNAQKSMKTARKQMKDARATVAGARKEAKRRGGATRDALTGRRPHRRWALLAGAIGLGVGAAAGAVGARMARKDRHLDELESTLSESVPPTGGSVTADRPPAAVVKGGTPTTPVPTSQPIVKPQAVATKTEDPATSPKAVVSKAYDPTTAPAQGNPVNGSTAR